VIIGQKMGDFFEGMQQPLPLRAQKLPTDVMQEKSEDL
jgi:hypothetical protein